MAHFLLNLFGCYFQKILGTSPNRVCGLVHRNVENKSPHQKTTYDWG
jgi:hypothetical protein